MGYPRIGRSIRRVGRNMVFCGQSWHAGTFYQPDKSHGHAHTWGWRYLSSLESGWGGRGWISAEQSSPLSQKPTVCQLLWAAREAVASRVCLYPLLNRQRERDWLKTVGEGLRIWALMSGSLWTLVAPSVDLFLAALGLHCCVGFL